MSTLVQEYQVKRSRTQKKRTAGRVKRQPALFSRESRLQSLPQVPKSALVTKTLRPKIVEKKYLDTYIEKVYPSTTGVVSTTVCNAVRLGNEASERIGGVINNTDIFFKGFLDPPAHPTAQIADAIRLMLIQDLQTNQATPSFDQLILNGVSANALSFRCLEWAPRFNVLWEQTYAVHKYDPTSTNEMIAKSPVIQFKGHIDLKKQQFTQTEFKGDSASTFADIVKGAIFWAYVALYNDGGVSTVSARVSILTRFRYTDP